MLRVIHGRNIYGTKAEKCECLTDIFASGNIVTFYMLLTTPSVDYYEPTSTIPETSNGTEAKIDGEQFHASSNESRDAHLNSQKVIIQIAYNHLSLEEMLCTSVF